MVDQPKTPFTAARASLQQTSQRLDSLLRTPTPSSPAMPALGKVIDGDVRVTTSEEELTEAVAEARKASPEKMEFLLGYVEELLRTGELKFTNSQTHAHKGSRQ